MKKVLLTSTALVVLAGAASAQTVIEGDSDGGASIQLLGNAEMGVFGSNVTIDHSFAGADDTDVSQKLQFYNSIDLDIKFSAETSGGLAFGADFDIDEADNLGNDTDDMGVTVFIESEFGNLTMGDTDGALDFVLQDMDFGNPGSINDAETVHLGFQGGYLDGQGDGQVVRYDYSFDAFKAALSFEQHDDCGVDGNIINAEGPGTPDCDDTELTWGIGFGYEFAFAGGSVDLGVGYQQASNVDSVLIVSNDVDGEGSINDFAGAVVTDPTGSLLDAGTTGPGRAGMVGVGAAVSLDSGLQGALTYTSTDFENVNEDLTHIGIGAGYSFDAFSVHANWGQYNIEDYTWQGYGIAAAYDLGGGASLNFGYGASSSDDFDFSLDPDLDADEYSSQVYSLGLRFNF